MNSSRWKSVEDRLAKLGVRPADITERFTRSGGAGGQNVNKVSTAVVLTHLPSGLTVRCEEERSQAANRLLARERLAERLERVRHDQAAKERSERERLKRQKRGRSRKAKERLLQDKRLRSKVKAFRKSPRADE